MSFSVASSSARKVSREDCDRAQRRMRMIGPASDLRIVGLVTKTSAMACSGSLIAAL
jgi:hypothetical protein